MAIEAIKEAVKKENGSFEIRKQAKVTGDTNALINDIFKEEQDEETMNNQDQNED